MKLWHVQKGSTLHSMLLGAVSFNSNAYKPEFADNKNPLMKRFSGNMMNFCEAVRHLVLWSPLYIFTHLLIIGLPLFAVIGYPMTFGTTASFVYYMIGAIAITTLVGVMFIFGLITSGANFLKEKARAQRMENFEKSLEACGSITPETKTSYMDIAGKILIRVFGFIGNCLMLFGLIPAIGKLIVMIYTMYKENFCPIITIVDEETTEGDA